MALSVTPSSTPAKIRNSVAAKAQVNSNRLAKATTAMPPTEMAQARSFRGSRGSSDDSGTFSHFQLGTNPLFRQIRPGIKPSEGLGGRSAARRAPGPARNESVAG